MADNRDAIEVITDDHREVEELFSRYERAGENGHRRRRQIVDDIIRELSVHAAIEEQFLYPYIRDNVPNGGELADHGIEDHQETKEDLARLEDLDPADPEFDRVIQAVITEVRDHVGEEERDFLPRLREAATPEQLRDLGSVLVRAKETAPTRPHPHAPNRPPGNIAAGAVTGVVDRIRDTVRGEED